MSSWLVKLSKLGKEGVNSLLFSDSGQRPMAGAENGFVRQGEDAFTVRVERILVGDTAASHRTRENRIADDRHGAGKATHDVGHAPRRMSPGRSRLDRKRADLKGFPDRKAPRAGNGFALTDPGLRASPLPETIQLEDVITMGMS